MNAWKVIAATLVIFIAGVVTGGLLVSSALRIARINTRPFMGANNPNNPAGPNALAANPWQARNRELMRRMDRELELTSDQHAQVEKIFVESQERTKSIWKPIAPMMNKEMQSVHGEIREVLNPDQRKKFDGFAKPHPGGQEKHHGATNSGPSGITNSGLPEALSTNAIPTGP